VPTLEPPSVSDAGAGATRLAHVLHMLQTVLGALVPILGTITIPIVVAARAIQMQSPN
jgi:hypothetical protein